jgi:hypothetical protein
MKAYEYLNGESLSGPNETIFKDNNEISDGQKITFMQRMS